MSRSRLEPRHGVIFGGLLFGAATVLNYIVGVNSTAMQFAEGALRRSISLQERVGTVSEVKLDKFWGFAHESGYGNSTARLSLVVVGERGSQEIDLSLKQMNGHWTVAGSAVPL